MKSWISGNKSNVCIKAGRQLNVFQRLKNSWLQKSQGYFQLICNVNFQLLSHCLARLIVDRLIWVEKLEKKCDQNYISFLAHMRQKLFCICASIISMSNRRSGIDISGTRIATTVTSTSDPFYQHGLTLIPAWIINYIHCKVWDEITYPLLNFNGATVEV